MQTFSDGEKWIKLLRAYCPVADNNAMQAEKVDRQAGHLNIPKLSFEHPAKALLLECFPLTTGNFRNVVLTGTAGDGKTSLCFELVKTLTGKSAVGKKGLEQIVVESPNGKRKITFIYDVTGWRTKNTSGGLSDADVAILERFALSALGKSDEFFVLAVNDGQLHELFRGLPQTVSNELKQLETELIGLHTRKQCDSGDHLRLVNLSIIPSERIMELCLAAVLDRPEWHCFEKEKENPLFTGTSSIYRNYKALSSPNIRSKLIILARIADVTGHHLPIRGVLCLLANALLGHPKAKDFVINPKVDSDVVSKSGEGHAATLHRTLFGENLSPNNRRKREIYRFLAMLHIGEETTNDLDELFIFGLRDQELVAAYTDLVAPDPFYQRNPDFEHLLVRYIRGDINSQDDTINFLSELASERRRVFLHASTEQIQKYHLWRISVFHHAREYLEEVLGPVVSGKSPSRLQLRKLASGLNRIWTGLLLAENANEIYLTTGLDLSTSPVSDIYLSQIELDSEVPGFEVVYDKVSCIPQAILRVNNREFSFPLTLSRFEFLCRVADGAMPSTFSKESCADFMALKQRCLRDLQVKANSRSLHLIDVLSGGTIQRLPIHLA